MRTATTPRRKAQYHPLSDRNMMDVRTHGFHDPRAFVPEHCGERIFPLAVGLSDIAVAYPGGMDPYQHLAVTRLSEVDLLHHLRLAERSKYRCLGRDHGRPFTSRPSAHTSRAKSIS